MTDRPSFAGTDGPRGNVVFNFTGRPHTDIVAFAMGYRRAGRTLARSLASSNGYPDYDGYPVFFLYRHAIELYMKAALVKAGELAGLLDVAPQEIRAGLFQHHELLTLYDGLDRILRASLPAETKAAQQDLKAPREFLEDVAAVDPKSFHFRYPINTAGTLAHPKHLVLNVLLFAERAEEVLELLDAIVTSVTVARDSKAEIVVAIEELLHEINGTA